MVFRFGICKNYVSTKLELDVISNLNKLTNGKQSMLDNDTFFNVFIWVALINGI